VDQPERDRAQLLEDLAELNAAIEGLGCKVLVSVRAGDAMPADDLRKAVKVSADHVVDLAHKLRGTL
jgi:hypothetical protein